MTPFLQEQTESMTSWTLGRNGRTLTCMLIQKPSGIYVLRIRHEGRRILDERCSTPQKAVARSLQAFHVFLARGWLPPNSSN